MWVVPVRTFTGFAPNECARRISASTSVTFKNAGKRSRASRSSCQSEKPHVRGEDVIQSQFQKEGRVKSALVCGAGGFIGSHLVKRLKREGFWVRGVDLKFPRFSETDADDFVIGDLRDQYVVRQVIDRRFDEIYQLAADMGGAGYIFTGEHDADVMHNSATINLNVINAAP